MSSMQAIRVTRTGGPDVLEHVTLPMPEPAAHEVLVRNLAIGVGMPDMLVRRGIYAWMPALPAVIGIESAGVIERIGAAVTSVSVGQPVYVNARDLPERSGGYAEFRLAPADAVHVLPPQIDLQQAAALGNYQVAESLLRMGPGFPTPESVAIYGAAGGVGSAAVQLARARGWNVIAVAGSDDKCAFCLAQGATHAVNYKREDAVAAICSYTGGKGVDLLLDIASGDTLSLLFSALAPLGIVVSYGFLEGEPGAQTVPAMRKRFGQSPGWRLFSMHSFDTLPEVRHELTRTVIGALATGRISPQIHERFALADAADAHRLFETKTATGKLLLLPVSAR